MNRYKGDRKRYNLPLVESYKSLLLSQLMEESALASEFADKIIRIPMPNRSLIVLYGAARYQWEHCVLREDIEKRRVCVAYREFTPPYLSEDSIIQSNDVGGMVLKNSKLFWDHSGRKLSAIC